MFLHVLPKVWRKDWPNISPRTIENSGEGQQLDVYLHEMDYIKLSGEFAEQLKKVANWPTADTKQLEGEGEASEPLWTRCLAPKDGQTDQVPQDSGHDQVVGMWRLISHFPELSRGLEVTPLLGLPILWRNPPEGLLEHLKQAFLNRADSELSHRKPQFTPSIEELNVVRGRLLIPELMQRQARHRLGIWCEFDDLTTDIEMWQAVRRAVAECVKANPPLAIACDARLRDTSIVSVPEILANASRVEPSIKSPNLKSLYSAALAILRQSVSVAAPDTGTPGMICNIKIATSDLWEALIKNWLENNWPKFEHTHQDYLQVFSAGLDKRPDIATRRTSDKDAPRVLILDAKYKPPPDDFSGPNGADMADQYQIYAYAGAAQCPAYLVYPSRDNEGKVVKTVNALNTGQKVGVLTLPFPTPGSTRIDTELRGEVRDHIDGILCLQHQTARSSES